MSEDRATELEWLKFFHREADFGPGDGDVRECIKEAFKRETGKKMPLGYNYNSDGEKED